MNEQLEKYKQAIKEGNEVFNMSEIARFIKMDISTFTKAIKGQNGANGKPANIPIKLLPKLSQYFKEKRIKI